MNEENGPTEESEILKQCGESVFYSPESLIEDDDVNECTTTAEETEILKQCGESIFYFPEPISVEDPESKLKLCGDSTFRLLKSVNDISQLTDAVLNIADADTESKTPVFDEKKEQLLRDVLYTVDSLMGKSGEWRVTKSNCHMGLICEVPTTTAVSLEEVLELLEKAFSTDRQTIQKLREEAHERKPAELSLSLTVLEAEIQSQKDAKGPTNSYVRIKVGPKFYKEHETPQIKGTRYPKWKQQMKIKIDEVLEDYLLIELWHEEEEIRKKRHKLTSHSTEPISKHILLGNLLLYVRDALESGINGWYKLQIYAGSNLNEVTRMQLSGELSCSSDVEDNSQETYDRLLKCLVDHHIMENSENFDQNTKDSASWRDKVPASVTAILSQYALILNLSQANQLLSWWNIVTNKSSSTEWTMVLTQFNNIKTSLVMGSYSHEQQQYLSVSLSKIIDNCMENVKHLQRCFPPDHPEKSKPQLTAMLQTIKSMQDHPKIRSLLKETIHSSLQDFVRAGLYGFSKHWWNKISELLSLCSKKKDDQLRIILTITKEVYNLLLNVSGFYDKIFSNEFDICCLKVAYQTIVEEMMQAVEPVIISCCEAIPVSLQMIGDDGVECDFLKGSPLMKIYKNLYRISRVRCSHSTQHVATETGIEDFHKLFEMAVLNQLALTTDRELNLIDEITSKDTLEPINSQDHFSASLLEATAIAHRMKVWWVELSCPDLEDRVRYLKRILKNLMFLATTYCDKLYKKLDFMFEGNDEDSQQIINKKVCVAITNMDLMMQEIGKLPVILGYKLIEKKIEEKHAREIQTMVENTTNNVRTTLETFIVAVVDRRKAFLESIIIKSCQGEGATYFLKDVLHPTMDILLKMLELSKTREFLKCLWNTLLKIMRNIITNDQQRSPSFHDELLKLVKKVFCDFTPESGEALEVETAETQEYTSLVDDLQVLAKETPALITSYYQERLKEQNDESVSSSASLVIRAWFQEGSKLMVHVIMVKGVVVPPEEQSNVPLDYYIKIQVLPEELCQLPESSTEVLKEDPATFDKEFEIDIGDKEESIRGDGVLLLILRDRNRTRSDTFLGESVVLLADVPPESSEAMNMFLKMTLPVYGENCKRILQVLSCRKSDKQATAFVKVLKKRYSIKSFLKDSKDEKERDDKEKEEKEKEYNG